jgi:hypothetical protein
MLTNNSFERTITPPLTPPMATSTTDVSVAEFDINRALAQLDETLIRIRSTDLVTVFTAWLDKRRQSRS